MELAAGFTSYPNRSGRSGVIAYKLIRDGIQIQFRNGAVYEYDVALTGAFHIDRMRRLAAQGRGLATYVSQQHRLKFRRTD